MSLKDFAGKRKILNIVPSLDTPVCADSTRKFNQKAAGIKNAVVLVISADLPFAASRFCSTEGINNVVTLSTLRGGAEFKRNYGVDIADGPIAGVTARQGARREHMLIQLVSRSRMNLYDAALAALK